MKKIIYFSITILLFLLIIGKIESHSFMKCVDWDFATDSCAAYPRNYRFYEQQGDGFLFQRGKFTKPVATELGQACGPAQRRTSSIFDLYSRKHPMGHFTPGQIICPQWPARNHANALRAGTVSFYLSPKMDNARSDPDQSTFFEHEIHSSPFGNCTKYYENTNNATCTACFHLPTNIESGQYILQFFWEFNPKEYYLTCADILIGGSAAAQNNDYNANHGFTPARPIHDQDYEDEKRRQVEEGNRLRQKQHEEYLEKQRELEKEKERERNQMLRDMERINAEKKRRQPTVVQSILKNGKLDDDFESGSWGIHSRKTPTHYETRPVIGNVLYFKCSTTTNCITAKGKTTLNINILGYKDVVENVQINLITKNQKIPDTLSLGNYIDSSFIDNEYNLIRIPLSDFTGSVFNGVTLSGYDSTNSDIIQVDNINLSN